MSDAGAVVIVGGGPAGLSAARAYRAAGGRAAVVIVTDDEHRPYQRPPLTKEFLRGEQDAADLALEDARWYAEHEVEVRHAHATHLDLERGRVEVAPGDGLTYGSCVLATGSEPQRPDVPGADLDGVHVIRTLTDAAALRRRVEAGARSALVVGSGFIGCEAAASLAARGLTVTMLAAEAAPLVGRLGGQVAERLAGWLRAEGVDVRPDRLITAIERDENAGAGALRVITAAEAPVTADVIVLGSGVAPRVKLAADAGLALGPEGAAVRCDASLRTSARGVFAAGDLALVDHPRAGRPIRVEHWGDALAHGEVVGRVLAGEVARWDSVPGFWSTIGGRTLKYAAWGDGFDDVRVIDHGEGAFTAWYARAGATVGVLTHDADEDYQRGRELVAAGAPPPS